MSRIKMASIVHNRLETLHGLIKSEVLTDKRSRNDALSAVAYCAASRFSMKTLVAIALGAIDAYRPNASQRRNPARS